MVDKNLINDYTEEKTCTYKNEYYSVRDNGAVFRHAKDKSKPRKYDEVWTFGVKNKQGYMYIGEHRVHIIVATAFYGENNSKVYVVDHIDTNRCNNRVENLRWLTMLENALNNPATLKKITYLCGGDIQKFLDDPGCLRDITGNNQDVSWMRTVSSDEAHAAYKKIIQWANKPITQPLHNKQKAGMGEWLFKDEYDYKPIKLVGDYTSYIKPEVNNVIPDDYIIQSLTQNAYQKNWKTPTVFPLCPTNITETPLSDYFNNLQIGSIISENEYSKSRIEKFCLYYNAIYIITRSIPDGLKPYGLVTITFENNRFIHQGSLYFSYTGAEKAYTLSQGLEWTGGDCIDDYC